MIIDFLDNDGHTRSVAFNRGALEQLMNELGMSAAVQDVLWDRIEWFAQEIKNWTPKQRGEAHPGMYHVCLEGHELTALWTQACALSSYYWADRRATAMALEV